MTRKSRIEIEGGLYHVITRGNNRQQIFNGNDDYQKFLSLLEVQKGRLPFFVYAYCLMTNHVHLLIERQADSIGRIMHRVLTGYAQYYNWKYQKVGHVLQGRHKAILCQSDRYLSELVRYIHLNPVRAKMVRRPEHYRYSSHRAYLGLEENTLVDVDPVLRHFGGKRKLARERYQEFVLAGMKLGHQEEFYRAEEGRILGGEEFVDATIHRLGETKRPRKARAVEGARESFDAEMSLAAVEKVCRVRREEFCSSGKSARAVRAKEALILIGRQAGATMKQLSELTGLSSSAVSCRHDAAQSRVREQGAMRELMERIEKQYRRRIKESKA